MNIVSLQRGSIGIVDYGMGNLASVHNALNYLGIHNCVVSDPSHITKFDKLILPGVGAFGLAIKRLKNNGFADEIMNFVLIKKRPILGICLGMQLLLDSSVEHGFHEGLGIINGNVDFLGNRINNLPIPHVGWNSVRTSSKSELLRDNSIKECAFYFVHSYYCVVADEAIVTGKAEYGIKFDVILESGNVFGVQFHPEKSQKCGLSLLNNFSKVQC